MKPAIGQRWRYKDSRFDFIAEVVALPNKAIVVQKFAGSYDVGYLYISTIEDNSYNGSWSYKYLEGQDKPQ